MFQSSLSHFKMSSILLFFSASLKKLILNILIPFGSGTIIPNGFIEVVLTHCMTFITKSIVNHVAISCISCPRMIFIEQRFFIFCKLLLDGNLPFENLISLNLEVNVGDHLANWAVLKTGADKNTVDFN